MTTKRTGVKRYRVSDLDGIQHYFFKFASAEAFAQKQVNASWSNETWTVVDRIIWKVKDSNHPVDRFNEHGRAFVTRTKGA